MDDTNQKLHWENIYATKEEQDFSWFQEYPKTSVEFLSLFNLSKGANIIDVGGGDSHFVDALIDLNYENIYVLDISAKAIERAKARLAGNASKVNWIVSDITTFIPPVRFDLWHDRAAFHFLTTEDKIKRYVKAAEHGIKKDGYMILGTFSENGPSKCSGLEIKQYSQVSMSLRFKNEFEKIKCIEELHSTPFKIMQHFLFCSFRKK
ncbi:MAG: class I SAM-dependent methyltransferase [Ferruginibacter sp.]